MNSCLIADTTKEERMQIVRDAMALSTLDAAPPTEDVMALVQLYIDGRLEIADILAVMLNRYHTQYV